MVTPTTSSAYPPLSFHHDHFFAPTLSAQANAKPHHVKGHKPTASAFDRQPVASSLDMAGAKPPMKDSDASPSSPNDLAKVPTTSAWSIDLSA